VIFSPWHIAALASTGVAVSGLVQTLLGYAASRAFLPAGAAGAAALPNVTVLKPLFGDEPMLAGSLESFFRQDYPGVQLVFGVQNAADPAIAIVEKLCRAYPDVDATLVVNARPHGTNRKIANLINMFPSARHDVLLISDSDMHVAPDYLRRVVEVLEQPGTGLVTTIYTGLPASGGLIGQLGSAYINQIFASGALMARYLGRQDSLGATMALTRATLSQVGGLAGLSPYVADDAVLGRRVRALGLQIRLAPTVPATTVSETRLGALFRHELRWARTIRAMAPIGFLLSALQYPVFWAGLAVAFTAGQNWAWALLAGAFLVRAATGRAIEHALGAAPTSFILAPARDLLSIAVMAASFFDDEVAWRGQVLSTAPDRALSQSGAAAFHGAPPVLAHGKG
jgi:ceramide glucosyltransferase